jgi:DNA (cytosine-5)-methyltransferase 1
VGVDIECHEDYPYPFVQDDAMAILRRKPFLSMFDVIHASPPCQRFSTMSHARPGLANDYPDLIGTVREALQAWGGTWIIENVPGAPLIDPITLCGQMFALDLYRHRLFESSIAIQVPAHPAHIVPASKAGHWTPGTVMSVAGHIAPMWKAREAMGIDWMRRDQLSEAIPPAYTRFIGLQLMDALVAA